VIRRQVISIHPEHPRSLRAGPTGARVDAAALLLIGEFVPARSSEFSPVVWRRHGGLTDSWPVSTPQSAPAEQLHFFLTKN